MKLSGIFPGCEFLVDACCILSEPVEEVSEAHDNIKPYKPRAMGMFFCMNILVHKSRLIKMSSQQMTMKSSHVTCSFNLEHS